MWIFGYGSLVWRPGFEFVERRPAYISGFARRFWQGSTDHRGVPGAPGRVATLEPRPDALCHGMAYRVEGTDAAQVIQQLDIREQGGYSQMSIELHFDPDAAPRPRALVYWATPDNPEFLGPCSIDQMAEQIARARGPSGSNLEYLTRLAGALRDLRADDPHVFELEAAVLARAERA